MQYIRRFYIIHSLNKLYLNKNFLHFVEYSEAGSDTCLELKCDTPNTECVYDVIKEKPVCMCKDEHYMYVDNECKAMCEKNEDCENGGACAEGKTCKCLEGFNGDHCKEISGCEDLMCDTIDAECMFDSEIRKATCVCRDARQVYVNEKCVAMCETNEDCQNGGACTEERTCKCLEGTNGDHCEEITACEDLKCEATDAECQFDFEILQAICVCKDESQFDFQL
ncbi:UNVERIFIED_CONTAM: eys [Trichonephila clavipes]